MADTHETNESCIIRHNNLAEKVGLLESRMTEVEQRQRTFDVNLAVWSSDLDHIKKTVDALAEKIDLMFTAPRNKYESLKETALRTVIQSVTALVVGAIVWAVIQSQL